MVKNGLYYFYTALAYVRGWLGWSIIRAHSSTCTTGLNGRGEAKHMFLLHGWKPYIYRKYNRSGGLSRTFIIKEDVNFL